MRIWMLLLFSAVVLIAAEHSPTSKATLNKSLASMEEPILLVTTIDGALHSINPSNGETIWKHNDKPVISIPMDTTTETKGPTFLPNPNDGSLYAMDPASENLQKLPFTIQELVNRSPMLTQEGTRYTGDKHDVWYGLNPRTGKKLKTITNQKLEETCPDSENVQHMYIGRSEYKMTIIDKKGSVYWNITYSTFASHVSEETPKNFNYMHLKSSSDGRMLSVDPKTGKILWVRNYGFPVVGIYAWRPIGGLYRLKLKSVEDETLQRLLRGDSEHESSNGFFQHLNSKQNMEANSLYIGQYRNGLYAMPSLSDDDVQLKEHSPSKKLLPGPEGDYSSTTTTTTTTTTSNNNNNMWRRVGYYKEPLMADISLPQNRHQKPQNHPVLTYDLQKDPVCYEKSEYEDSDGCSRLPQVNVPSPHNDRMPSYGIQPDDEWGELYSEEDKTPAINWDVHVVDMKTVFSYFNFLMEKDNKNTVFAVVFTIVVVWLYNRLSKWFNRNSTYMKVGDDGWISVGKISYDTVEPLGRGSEGTIVYRGRFDNREVAIKRIIAQVCTFADREVMLLRESDDHNHVVRYYCTEKCDQFRYIALELCSQTLQDFVENPAVRSSTGLDESTVLHQAMKGLHHLHQLKIVHRDVKPSNILISKPDKLGVQRVVLSDFGLCKKVTANASFSHRSGRLAGTDGWIAPEMIGGTTRMTQKVDIFSMGCVFYYVICGKHPFGDSLHRQCNILEGKYDVEILKHYEKYEEAKDIITRMLEIDPKQRPKTDQILAHPLFWDSSKTLQFFEDVSDRVEKEYDTSPIVRVIDRRTRLNAFGVNESIASDWQNRICNALLNDIKKHRTYKNDSVKDLLRAIRNKKHHYRELDDVVKHSLGEVPEQFLEYFKTRFPSLVIHTYNSLAVFQNESELKSYYGTGSFHFKEIDQLRKISNNKEFANNENIDPQNSNGKKIQYTNYEMKAIGRKYLAKTSSKPPPPPSSAAGIEMSWRRRLPDASGDQQNHQLEWRNPKNNSWFESPSKSAWSHRADSKPMNLHNNNNINKLKQSSAPSQELLQTPSSYVGAVRKSLLNKHEESTRISVKKQDDTDHLKDVIKSSAATSVLSESKKAACTDSATVADKIPVEDKDSCSRLTPGSNKEVTASSEDTNAESNELVRDDDDVPCKNDTNDVNDQTTNSDDKSEQVNGTTEEASEDLPKNTKPKHKKNRRHKKNKKSTLAAD